MPRPDVFSLLGTPHHNIARIAEDWKADWDDSDGIARVHGMSNVQAEELVEYAKPHLQARDQEANGIAGSPLVSRACA